MTYDGPVTGVLCDDCGRFSREGNHAPPAGSFHTLAMLALNDPTDYWRLVCRTCHHLLVSEFRIADGRIEVQGG